MSRKIQTEPFPDLWDHDFVVRVTHWSSDYRPQGIEGIYVCGPNTEESLRTGNRPGQTVRDVVGQRADLERISEQMPIYRYPIIGVQFDRLDGVNVVQSNVNGVPLNTFSPSVTSGVGAPTAIASTPGTIYIDTTTGTVYQWD